jgi:hypothetical protein
MMVFEFEGNPSVEQLQSVVLAVGASVEVEESGFSGAFSQSNAFFVYSQYPFLEDIAAEHEHIGSLGWKVGATLVVHCPIDSLAESAKELDGFIAALVDLTDIRFVLSFQYESVYAVRDRNLVIYKKIIDE